MPPWPRSSSATSMSWWRTASVFRPASTAYPSKRKRAGSSPKERSSRASRLPRQPRRGDMSPDAVVRAMSRLLAIGIALGPFAPLLPRAARLAVDLQHPVYDCIYLVLAGERDIALASADERLRRVAERLDVRLWRR